MTTAETQLLPALFARLAESPDRVPSERDLAEHFGVSRGQVRENLAILEALRLIERRAKSGIRLAEGAGLDGMALAARAGLPLDPRRVYEAVELRKIHEIKAAELAARRATDEDFARLEDVLARSERRIADGEGLDGLDAEFHLLIVRATGNDLFWRVCEAFYAMGHARLAVYFRDPERSRRSHAEHRRILDALKGRDAILAQALMNAHLGAALSYWGEILEGQGDGPRG